VKSNEVGEIEEDDIPNNNTSGVSMHETSADSVIIDRIS